MWSGISAGILRVEFDGDFYPGDRFPAPIDLRELTDSRGDFFGFPRIWTLFIVLITGLPVPEWAPIKCIFTYLRVGPFAVPSSEKIA